IARVKPAETGAKTNLDLQTTKHLYSFRLREATGTKAAPDFKVFVRPEEPGHVRYVPIADLEALQAELKEARAALAAEQRRSADAIKAHKTQYVTTLQFAYRWEDKDDLRIRAIWHDGQSTYLQLQGRELPALYADKDGPALTNYQVLGGRTYVVPKVLERGTLAVGKTRVRFERR
ncbi:MAG: TrbG/VirB9 family P-type conjugative transfer protein, partial [Dehalococcoidia bacterium]